MSFLSNLFGGKKVQIAKPSEAIQKLRDVETMLEKKSEYLEKKISEQRNIIKTNGMKAKKVSLQALKRMKRYEKRLQEIDGTLETINHQRSALEDASMNTSVLQAMKEASDALKGANLTMNIDEVHSMINDVAEHQDFAADISEAISNSAVLEEDLDEDELAKELQALEEDVLDESVTASEPKKIPELPDVPSVSPGKTKGKAVKESKTLKKLGVLTS